MKVVHMDKRSWHCGRSSILHPCGCEFKSQLTNKERKKEKECLPFGSVKKFAFCLLFLAVGMQRNISDVVLD